MSTWNKEQTRDFQHSQWQKEVAALKEAVKINSETGMSNDIDAIIQMCHDIIDIPRSADSLMAALFDISQVTQQTSYPSESRKTIIDAFEYVLKASKDRRVQTQLPIVIYRLKRIDSPESSDESLIHNNPGKYGDDEPNARTSNPYGGISKGQRTFSITPRYSSKRSKGRR